jgi:hypothetical protein
LILLSFAGLTFLLFRSIHCCVVPLKAVSGPCDLCCFLNRYREDPPVLAHEWWLSFWSRLGIASALIVGRAGARTFRQRVPAIGIERN